MAPVMVVQISRGASRVVLCGAELMMLLMWPARGKADLALIVTALPSRSVSEATGGALFRVERTTLLMSPVSGKANPVLKPIVRISRGAQGATEGVLFRVLRAMRQWLPVLDKDSRTLGLHLGFNQYATDSARHQDLTVLVTPLFRLWPRLCDCSSLTNSRPNLLVMAGSHRTRWIPTPVSHLNPPYLLYTHLATAPATAELSLTANGEPTETP